MSAIMGLRLNSFLMSEIFNNIKIFRSRRKLDDNIKLILIRWVGGRGMNSSELESGPVTGLCVQKIKFSGSMNDGEFLL
jgi:hypothetical protein